MEISAIDKIFKKAKDCHALVSNRNDGWTSVKQIDAMSKESFIKATEDILKEFKKEYLSKNKRD